MNMSVDKNIRRLRKQAGWTQEELAQLLALVSGIALGCILLSVIRPKRTALWAAAGLLALVLPVGYVAALTMDIPYWVLIAWDIQPYPWIFLPVGVVLGLAGGAVWKRIGSGKAK